jgi:hypothetical protein
MQQMCAQGHNLLARFQLARHARSIIAQAKNLDWTPRHFRGVARNGPNARPLSCVINRPDWHL